MYQPILRIENLFVDTRDYQLWNGSSPNGASSLEVPSGVVSLLRKLIDASPAPVNAARPRVFELRKWLSLSKRAVVPVMRQGYALRGASIVRREDDGYGTRLFSAFTREVLVNGLSDGWRVPNRTAWVVYAAEVAVMNSAGDRRLPRPGERLRSGEKRTSAALTGDVGAIHQAGALLARFRCASRPVAAPSFKEELAKAVGAAASSEAGPLFFVGGPYANELLADYQARESARPVSKPRRISSFFDMKAPVQRRSLAIDFKHRTGRTRARIPLAFGDEGEFAVVRRWCFEDDDLPLGNKRDAILVGGMTSRGTSAALAFLLSENSMAELFKVLKAEGATDEGWEHLAFDALLQVPPRLGDSSPDAVAVLRKAVLL